MITMGCGDACPFFPGKRYEDWELDDPAGKGVDAVRPIRDEIRRRVENLISEWSQPTPDKPDWSPTSTPTSRSLITKLLTNPRKVAVSSGHG